MYRKKLSDLKTEEFLSFGLDSDIEDDIQEDADHQETENHIKYGCKICDI